MFEHNQHLLLTEPSNPYVQWAIKNHHQRWKKKEIRKSPRHPSQTERCEAKDNLLLAPQCDAHRRGVRGIIWGIVWGMSWACLGHPLGHVWGSLRYPRCYMHLWCRFYSYLIVEIVIGWWQRQWEWAGSNAGLATQSFTNQHQALVRARPRWDALSLFRCARTILKNCDCRIHQF